MFWRWRTGVCKESNPIIVAGFKELGGGIKLYCLARNTLGAKKAYLVSDFIVLRILEGNDPRLQYQ
jgi:hypothetical protein